MNSSGGNLSKCPKCGKPTDLSLESCQACGLVFSKYYNIRGGAIKSCGEKAFTYGRFRLLVDILMGIFGISMILSGGVFIFVLSAGGNRIPVPGGTFSSLALGFIAFIIGLSTLAFSALGIARSMK